MSQNASQSKQNRMNNGFTLYGLKENSKTNITYDVEKKEVVLINNDKPQENEIQISDEFSFTIPTYIIINGIPLFPSKYEIINTGTVVYSKRRPPKFNINIIDDNFNNRAIIKKNTIGLKDLKFYDVNGRKRHISQNKIMGESASEHAQKLIENGILTILPEIIPTIQWHWCHLIAFRMLPSEKAQKKNNLVCATSACNGHMANIESAIKRFIYEFKRPLGLEITAETYVNTQLARTIRYRVYDKRSGLTHSEYFNALTDTKTDTLDHFSIYNRLVEMFTKKT